MPELNLPELNTKQPKWLMAFVKDAEGKAAINEEERSLIAVISSDQLDRDKEIITTEAIATAIKGFAANPVALACHQHRLDNGKSPVVGKWDTDSYKQLAHRSEMKIIFAATELAEEYWQLYKGGFMKAFSIGFIPKKWHQASDDKNGLHYVIDEIELFEISCVPVGSNRQALAKIKELGIDVDYYNPSQQQPASEKSFADLESVIEKIGSIDTRLTELADETYDSLEEIKSLLITGQGTAEPGESEHSEPDDPQSRESAESKAIGEIYSLLNQLNQTINHKGV